jgi:predicted methyltransferase
MQNGEVTGMVGATKNIFRGFLAFLLLTSAGHAETDAQLQALESAVAGDQRSAEYKLRDQYRHPVETLTFFGIRNDMTVVEITPGGGWYTEILASLVRDNGKLYAANYDTESTGEYYRDNANRFLEKLAADPAVYDAVIATVFDPPAKLAAAPAGSADMVLTFRNIHNWMEEGSTDQALSAIYNVLKPGGILGVVQHRQDKLGEQDPKALSGYVREDYAIALIEAAGFELVAQTEINANSKDTRDYPEGVWSLPPTYEQGDVDQEKYTTIGESDRMTLKFIKPE